MVFLDIRLLVQGLFLRTGTGSKQEFQRPLKPKAGIRGRCVEDHDPIPPGLYLLFVRVGTPPASRAP